MKLFHVTMCFIAAFSTAALAETPSTASPSVDTTRGGSCHPGQIECGYLQNCMQNGGNCVACPQDYGFGGPSGCYRCSSGTSLVNENGEWACK